MKDDSEVLERGQAMTSIVLTARKTGNEVKIDGDRSKKFLAVDENPRQFNFTLTDNTGLDVQFTSLDSQDSWPNCPPPEGPNSRQIVGGHINPSGKSASFTDNNNNPAKNGPIDVCYQWRFTCKNDPSVPVETFDPIIENGGRN